MRHAVSVPELGEVLRAGGRNPDPGGLTPIRGDGWRERVGVFQIPLPDELCISGFMAGADYLTIDVCRRCEDALGPGLREPKPRFVRRFHCQPRRYAVVAYFNRAFTGAALACRPAP